MYVLREVVDLFLEVDSGCLVAFHHRVDDCIKLCGIAVLAEQVVLPDNSNLMDAILDEAVDQQITPIHMIA